MAQTTFAAAALAALRSALPADRISIDDADRLAHGKDAWPALAKWSRLDLESVAPAAVVRPQTAREVSVVLATAAKYKIPVVPYAAGSGVVGGAVPEGPAISLDTRALNGIVAFSPTDLMVTVESGTPAIELERYLNERGHTLGHYPQSLPLATVGGLVATRSSGTFSSKYGNIEEMVLALEVVLPDGSLVANKPVPRSSTGPRLSDLFIGSEGTLGVITRVTLKVLPLPEVRCFRGLAFADLNKAVSAVRELFVKGLKPAVIRLYDVAEAEHLFERVALPAGRNLLILGFDGPRRLVETEEALVLELCSAFGGEDLGRAIGEGWEGGRFNATWLEEGNAGETKLADAIEVSGAWSVLPAIYERVTAAIRPYTDRLWAHYSHFYGQGGSIYFIIFASGESREAALAKYHKIWSTVMEEVLACGGSISHHHGIGRMRAPYLAAELGTSFELLRRVKAAVDPEGILNPGKLGLK